MENASEALIMAGSVLLLIIALTVNISSLMGLKTQMQDFLESRYQIQSVTDENEYLSYIKSNKNVIARKVGVETIISAIRRMAKENYVIHIKTNNINSLETSEVKKYTMLSEITIETAENSDLRITDGEELLNVTQSRNIASKYIQKKEVIKRIYEILKDNTYDEYIGMYKEKKKNDGVLEAERDTYKVITFVQAN